MHCKSWAFLCALTVLQRNELAYWEALACWKYKLPQLPQY